MRTKAAPTIRLKDYTPPQFAFRDVHLDVSLDPETTKVRSSLTVMRKETTSMETPLVLDGDELNLVRVSANGKVLDPSEYTATPQQLELRDLPSDKMFKIDIETELTPVENKKLMGLYQSNGVYCTQCEAEGFRRITYFLDRPDVLSVYTVRLEADHKSCPLLLSNGNIVKNGNLPKGRHFTIWHDPHPKPSYLFALVGGNLDAYSDRFETASGRNVDLNIYVETGKAEMASYAMDALKRSMTWDEQVYGREYDLDVFNIVAVSDFNMGAMENKGLNVFNDKYVLADPDVATDTDYMHIEAIIAHEYFHNWTGNRITCRDWFQLCLKEGLTVYRDQEFSADQRSATVQRIQQVRGLKSGQFAEDAGPLAHSVRPAAYREINNFYTATVYQKGSELVRMLSTIVGPQNYRKSTDLYFERHDGEAAVVEDWLKSFEDAAQIDLSQFSRWYEQAGTPVVEVKEKYDRKAKTYTLTFDQSVPPTPGQEEKQIVPIPVRFGLLDKDGKELKPVTKSKSVKNGVILVDRKSITVTFSGLSSKPFPSLLRQFSAPVTLKFKETDKARLLRARHDSDLYNRWEALNGFALQLLTKDALGRKPSDSAFVEALSTTVLDTSLEAGFRAQVLTLPSEQDLAREIGKDIDPEAIAHSYKALSNAVGKALGGEGLKLAATLEESAGTATELEASGMRALKNALLQHLVAAKAEGALDFAQEQFKLANNMTDRLAALKVLVLNQSDSKLADAALDQFYERHKSNHIVVDKWFNLQALIPGARGLKRVKDLTKHPTFSLENPNRARALLGAFAAGNMTGFHRADGKGYEFYADQILALDKINPQVAARLLTLINNWRMLENDRAQKAKTAWSRIADSPDLSGDVQEIVDRALN